MHRSRNIADPHKFAQIISVGPEGEAEQEVSIIAGCTSLRSLEINPSQIKVTSRRRFLPNVNKCRNVIRTNFAHMKLVDHYCMSPLWLHYAVSLIPWTCIMMLWKYSLKPSQRGNVVWQSHEYPYSITWYCCIHFQLARAIQLQWICQDHAR